MKTELSANDIDSYRDQGFLVIEELLNEEELGTWREAVDNAVDDHELSGRDFDPTQSDYYDRVFLQRVNLWKTSEAVRELVIDKRLGRLAATLAGVETVRLYNDHSLIKKPWANPTNWHADNPYDPYHSPEATMLWVALDNATTQNGCLLFLPGTHKRISFDSVAPLDVANIGGFLEAHPELAKVEPVTAEVVAGAGIFINGMVAHAAGANMTSQPRRAFSMLYIPGECHYSGHPGALPERLIARLEKGDVLDDDEELPLLYQA